jgi:hypothetical protein
MSAHCGRVSMLHDRNDSDRRSAHLVQTTVWVSVGDDLDGSILALGQVQVAREGQVADAEVVGSFLLDGLHESNAVRAVAVAQCHVDLNFGIGVVHVELDGTAGEREWSAGGYGVEASAGKVDGLVIVEAAAFGPDEKEVSRGDGQESEELEHGCEYCA